MHLRAMCAAGPRVHWLHGHFPEEATPTRLSRFSSRASGKDVPPELSLMTAPIAFVCAWAWSGSTFHSSTEYGVLMKNSEGMKPRSYPDIVGSRTNSVA